MDSKAKQFLLVFAAFSLIFVLNVSMPWAANPAPEKSTLKPAEGTKPSEPTKKGEKFVVKGREYCYECIDNSECLG